MHDQSGEQAVDTVSKISIWPSRDLRRALHERWSKLEFIVSSETFDDRRNHTGSLEGDVTRWISRISSISMLYIVFMCSRRHVRAV